MLVLALLALLSVSYACEDPAISYLDTIDHSTVVWSSGAQWGANDSPCGDYAASYKCFDADATCGEHQLLPLSIDLQSSLVLSLPFSVDNAGGVALERFTLYVVGNNVVKCAEFNYHIDVVISERLQRNDPSDFSDTSNFVYGFPNILDSRHFNTTTTFTGIFYGASNSTDGQEGRYPIFRVDIDLPSAAGTPSPFVLETGHYNWVFFFRENKLPWNQFWIPMLNSEGRDAHILRAFSSSSSVTLGTFPWVLRGSPLPNTEYQVSYTQLFSGLVDCAAQPNLKDGYFIAGHYDMVCDSEECAENPSSCARSLTDSSFVVPEFDMPFELVRQPGRYALPTFRSVVARHVSTANTASLTARYRYPAMARVWWAPLPQYVVAGVKEGEECSYLAVTYLTTENSDGGDVPPEVTTGPYFQITSPPSIALTTPAPKWGVGLVAWGAKVQEGDQESLFAVCTYIDDETYDSYYYGDGLIMVGSPVQLTDFKNAGRFAKNPSVSFSAHSQSFTVAFEYRGAEGRHNVEEIYSYSIQCSVDGVATVGPLRKLSDHDNARTSAKPFYTEVHKPSVVNGFHSNFDVVTFTGDGHNQFDDQFAAFALVKEAPGEQALGSEIMISDINYERFPKADNVMTSVAAGPSGQQFYVAGLNKNTASNATYMFIRELLVDCETAATSLGQVWHEHVSVEGGATSISITRSFGNNYLVLVGSPMATYSKIVYLPGRELCPEPWGFETATTDVSQVSVSWVFPDFPESDCSEPNNWIPRGVSTIRAVPTVNFRTAPHVDSELEYEVEITVRRGWAGTRFSSLDKKDVDTATTGHDEVYVWDVATQVVSFTSGDHSVTFEEIDLKDGIAPGKASRGEFLIDTEVTIRENDDEVFHRVVAGECRLTQKKMTFATGL